LGGVGILFDVDRAKESQFLKQIWVRNATVNEADALDEKSGYHTLDTPIDMMQAFGPVLDGPFYRYHGSLTTPPCSESVKWFVFEKALPMSMEQWLAFKEVYPNPNNNRPMQAVNGRTIWKNSFQEGTPNNFDFYLYRNQARNRDYKSDSMILLPVFGSIVLAIAVMVSTFNRDVFQEKHESAGGLRAVQETLNAQPEGSRLVGKSV